MRKILIFIALLFMAGQPHAQVEPGAGKWKTWFITSGKDYRLPAPSSYKPEITEVLSAQKNLDAMDMQQIMYWNAGAPGYRWREIMDKLWVVDTSYSGALANLLLNTAIYDATVAAWDTKYAYNRPRPFTADGRIKAYVPKPESPSYPCEHSVAAGVAVTIFSKFYPSLADSVKRMAERLMASRIAAGVAFPDDTRAGFALGKKIAEKGLEHTKNYVTTAVWDGKMPAKPGLWNGKKPMLPLAGLNKPVVLDSSSQFRPGPPPDYAKEMEELKKHKPNFRTLSNAFYWANQMFFGEYLHKKIFEYNLHLNPPRAARLHAVMAIGTYDGFISCWDAKYAYWGIRPNQYDTTYRPPIMVTPPFPGYPSGHAAVSGVMSELLSYFFPEDKALLTQKAKEAAESRFQAGIHFRSDNEVGLEMGKKVGAAVIRKVKSDGADEFTLVKGNKTDTKPKHQKTP